jgi:hypothetical protein
MTFTSLYKGGFDASKLFSEAVLNSPSISDGLVRIIPNVKYATNVPVLGGSLPAQAYGCEPTASSTLTYTERNLILTKIMFYDEICMDSLRSTYANQSMKAGAANLEAPQFEAWLETYAAQLMGAEIEKLMWSGATTATKATVDASGLSAGLKAIVAGMPTKFMDSFVADAILSGVTGTDPILVAGTTLSASNIIAELDKIYAVIPAENFVSDNEAKLRIFLPFGAKRFVVQANNKPTTDNFRPFDLVDGKYSYNGVAISFVGLDDNTALAGLAGVDGNLVIGTDLESDMNTISIGKVNNSGDNMFIKGLTVLGTASIIQGQVVVYGS